MPKRPHEFWCKTCSRTLETKDFWYSKTGARFARCKECDYALKQSRRVQKRNGINKRIRKHPFYCGGCDKTRTEKDFYYAGKKKRKILSL